MVIYCYVSQLWLLRAPNSVAWIYVKWHPYLQTCLCWHLHARRRNWACLALAFIHCCQNSSECEEMQHWCPTCPQDHGDSLLRNLCSGQKYSYSPFCRTIFCFQNSLLRGPFPLGLLKYITALLQSSGPDPATIRSMERCPLASRSLGLCHCFYSCLELYLKN